MTTRLECKIQRKRQATSVAKCLFAIAADAKMAATPQTAFENENPKISMTQKRSPAREVAVRRGQGYWIEHAAIAEEDHSWLKIVKELTLWNVTMPSGFLGLLPDLAWLDLRGGSARTLDVRGARALEYLAVNQVRELVDLSDVPSLERLRYLNLYGLAKLSRMPSLAGMKALKRIEIGQMKILESLAPILAAPRLRELLLRRNINVNPSDIRLIQNHATLEQFNWISEDVPAKRWEPVLRAVTLPKARSMHPEDWFASDNGPGIQG